MTDERRLDNLPSDVLLLIFDYCHAFDLVRLSEVCTRFNKIVADDVLWFERRNKPLASNQASKRFRERCYTLLCLRTRWHVTENWQIGKYKQTILHSWHLRAMPWICLMKNTIWWSSGNQLSAFHRRRKRKPRSRDSFVEADKIFDRNGINSDILKFVVRDNYVISGHSDGVITYWSRSSKRQTHQDLRIENAHASNINAVDELSGVTISGSADGTVKLWSQPHEGVPSIPLAKIDVMDRIWSLKADPIDAKFAVGSSGSNGIPPLKILDIEWFVHRITCINLKSSALLIFSEKTKDSFRCIFNSCSESISMRHPWRRGAGILDMIWENPNILLTCGYDTCVRKWDVRMGSCVASWTDPTDAAIYCISSDYRHTIVAGTQYNCKTVLWDQRMKNYMQLYFLNNVDRKTSPVYSISFDSSHLYGTTDRRLVELTFSGYDYCQTDYRNIVERTVRVDCAL